MENKNNLNMENTDFDFKIKIFDKTSRVVVLAGNNDDPDEWIEGVDKYVNLYIPNIEVTVVQNGAEITHIYTVKPAEEFNMQLVSYDETVGYSDVVNLKELPNILESSDDCEVISRKMNGRVFSLNVNNSTLTVKEQKIGNRTEIQLIF